MDCLRENYVLHSKTSHTLKLNMEIEIRKPGEEERIRQRGGKGLGIRNKGILESTA